MALRLMTTGYIVPRCLHVVAELGVADAIAEESVRIADVARAVKADPDALSRVLRLLSAHGVFVAEGESVRHNGLSRLLRGDDPHSMRPYVRMIGSPLNWQAYGDLASTVQSGRPAIGPDRYWSHLRDRPDQGAVFNAAMAARGRDLTEAVVAAYDFAPFERIADIGGGQGHLLRAVLRSAPGARGFLFDLPQAIAEARAEGALDRIELREGSFFEEPLPAADLYLLMEVIHDWPDGQALEILRAVRRAAPRRARLLVLEAVVPDTGGPHLAKGLDVHMMVLLGGRQRTRAEYEALLSASGFVLKRQIETGPGVSILEAEVR